MSNFSKRKDRRSYEITVVCSLFTSFLGQFDIFLKSRWLIFSDFFHEGTVFHHKLQELTEPNFWKKKFLCPNLGRKGLKIGHLTIFFCLQICHSIFLRTYSISLKTSRNKNHCGNSLLIPNSIRVEILGSELLPTMIS